MAPREAEPAREWPDHVPATATAPEAIWLYQPGVAVEWRSPRNGWQPGHVVEGAVFDRPGTTGRSQGGAVQICVRPAVGADLDTNTFSGGGPRTGLTLTVRDVRPVAWSTCARCGEPITDPDNVPHDDSALCAACGDPS